MSSETSGTPDASAASGGGGTWDDEPEVNTGVVRTDRDEENLDGPSSDSDSDSDSDADEVPDGHA